MKTWFVLGSVFCLICWVGCGTPAMPEKGAKEKAATQSAPPEKVAKEKPAVATEPAAAPQPATPAGNEAAVGETHFAKVISQDSFEADVLKSDQVVLVDCWATWCGPCLKIAPVIEEIAKEFEGQAVVAKLDVDNAPEISSKYKIEAIPALLFFKNGEVVDTIVGAQPKEQIVAKLKSVMGQ